MSFYRYAAEADGTVIQSNYDSDGKWVGSGSDPRTKHMSYWYRIQKTLVTEELVKLASERSGIKIELRPHVSMYRDLDLSNNRWAELWAIFPVGGFMGRFNSEFERLQRLVKRPLDEPELADDELMYCGYWYVFDGETGSAGFSIDNENGGMPVADFKKRFGWKVIQRCDVIGRRLRQPVNPEFGEFAKGFIPPVIKAEEEPSNRPWYNTKKRRPRNSNKIKKVK